MNKILQLFIILLSVSSLLFAQTDWGENMELVDIPIEYSFPSGVIMGDYSIGMDRLGIIIWSIEDPDNPTFLKRFPIRGDQSDWFMTGDILYVHSEFEDHGYLDVIEMRDPVNPRYISQTPLPGEYDGQFTKIFPHSDFIYATGESNPFMYRLSIADDPYDPDLTGWRAESIGNPLCYNDNLVVSCLEGDNRNELLNISIMSEAGIAVGSVLQIENGQAYRASIKGDLLYVHAGEDWLIIDIADPEDASIVSELEGMFQATTNITLHTSERYRFHRDVGDNIAVGDRGRLRIFSLEDPTEPELVVQYDCPAYHYTIPSLVVNNRMFAPVYENRSIDLLTDTLSLQIYDISNPDEPELSSEIAIMTFYPSHLLISNSGNLLGFGNCNSHYNIYEIHEDESLELRSIIESEEVGVNQRLNGVNGVIHNNMAFVAKGTEGLSAYSLDDPSHPELFESFDIQNAWVCGVFDSTLLLTTNDGHLNRIDVSDRDQLVALPEINVEEFSLGYLSTMDEYIVSRENGQVCAYSIEENNTLQPRYSVGIQGRGATKIAVVDTLIITSEFRGNNLYEDWVLLTLRIDERIDTIRVLDRADWVEGDPRYNVPVAARDDGLVAAVGNTRIVIYDVTNPRAVTIAGTCLTPNWSANGAVWHDDCLYTVGMDDICRFRLLISDDPPILTPDTLDFGVQSLFSVNWASYILSSPGGEGLSRIIESGFEGNMEPFLGFEEFSGWVSSDFEKEVRIRFRPLEVDAYTVRIWYRTEVDTISVVLKGMTEGYNGISAEETASPWEFAITDIHPNPFNSSTRITYTVPEQSQITLRVFNTQGKVVEVLQEGEKPAGIHSLVWNGDNLAAGIYFAELIDGNNILQGKTRKLIMLK